jgi:DNA polymerase III delta prime subunit
MFDNIIGQKAVVQTLAAELAEGRLPRAALLAGPPYSGKLSTALELARGLGCREGRGEWSCGCSSCLAHKELAHPHTVLMGARYSDVEIAASADALLRNRRPATCYLFIRAVRKLTRRFDPAIYDAEDARMKAVQGKAAQVEELLLDLVPSAELPPERELADLTAQIIEACAQLAELARNDTIGVGQVRLLSAWAHATSESRKVAILENADRMLDSARNALLRLLEEPPEGVHLLLLTTRRSAMLPTVVSRLRPYLFSQRTPQEEAEVLEKIFRVSAPGRSLRGYFLAWKQINAEALARLSRLFVEKALRPDPSTDILEDLRDVFASKRSQKEAAVSFLEELTLRLRELLRDAAAPLEVLEQWTAWVRETVSKLEMYNVSPPSAVEELFFRMRAAAGAAFANGVPAGGGLSRSAAPGAGGGAA